VKIESKKKRAARDVDGSEKEYGSGKRREETRIEEYNIG